MLPVLVGITILVLFIWACNPLTENLNKRPYWLGQTRLVYPFPWRYPDNIRIGLRAPSNVYNNPANVNIYKPYS